MFFVIWFTFDLNLIQYCSISVFRKLFFLILSICAEVLAQVTMSFCTHSLCIQMPVHEVLQGNTHAEMEDLRINLLQTKKKNPKHSKAPFLFHIL